MFKINYLELLSFSQEKYRYKFESGINYYKGANDTGKTEFYSFLDYMFGSSERFDNKYWFSNSLKEAIIEFEYKNKVFQFRRTYEPDVNYFLIDNGEWSGSINLLEYKEKMNTVFSPNEEDLKKLREFTDEDLTFRTFTVFNFLGEKALGYLVDFFDKGRNLKYSIKLQAILNYIFNKNISEISRLRNELELLQENTDNLLQSIRKSEFIINKINENVSKLGIQITYNGKNKEEIKEEVKKIKQLNEPKKTAKKNRTLNELEIIYNSISEQIKVYENRIEDTKKFQVENENRLSYLGVLDELINDKPDYQYLVKPISDLLNELSDSISFNSYILTNNTIKELKKQKELVKREITNNDNKYICFNVSEKEKAIAIIEEMLDVGIDVDIEELQIKRRKLVELKEAIRTLQNLDDKNKIEELSEYITQLYLSTNELSDLVNADALKESFSIQYFKKGNMLQPMIKNENEESEKIVINYYVGSLARQTLIQLCGYLGFIKLLVLENRYPIIPVIVIDHISKPFDHTNRNAIGGVLNEFYKSIKKEDVQIFMFDDENSKDLSINSSHQEDLVLENKTGFNPFYIGNKITKYSPF